MGRGRHDRGDRRPSQRRKLAVPAEPAPPLEGLRVLDVATLFAGPLAATILGDFGADVIKVEHPRKGDPVRCHGPAKDGVAAVVEGARPQQARRSRSTWARPTGQELLPARWRADADVLIENFRPGTLERWGLGRDELLARVNPRPGPGARHRLRPVRAVRRADPGSAPSPRR